MQRYQRTAAHGKTLVRKARRRSHSGCRDVHQGLPRVRAADLRGGHGRQRDRQQQTPLSPPRRYRLWKMCCREERTGSALRRRQGSGGDIPRCRVPWRRKHQHPDRAPGFVRPSRKRHPDKTGVAERSSETGLARAAYRGPDELHGTGNNRRTPPDRQAVRSHSLYLYDHGPGSDPAVLSEDGIRRDGGHRIVAADRRDLHPPADRDKRASLRRTRICQPVCLIRPPQRAGIPYTAGSTDWRR